ncbi:MAG: DEAD/DEAH box helicase family protein, partial [Nitrososphaeraceae archaeon]
MKKILVSNQKKDQLSTIHSKNLEMLKGLPFWIWDTKEHKKLDIETKGNCCFSHACGLPTKDGLEKPLFDYQQSIFDILNPLDSQIRSKYLWIKKATGLGITEFFLRYMGWLCLRDDTYQNTQMCIVTGPNIDISKKLIKRLKQLFENKLGIVFSSKETVLELNGCTIEAFPSNHLDSMRSLTDVKFIFIDEADFFRIGEQQNVIDVSHRYIAKSDPVIVMVSTPNAPGGLFEQIELDMNSIYKKIFLDYTVGLGKIYSFKEIENAKKSPSFEREYNLVYGYGLGNCFLPEKIDYCTQIKYDPNNIESFRNADYSLGIDPGWGSSKFAFCVTRLVQHPELVQDGTSKTGDLIEVVYCNELERTDFNTAISEALDLIHRYKPVKIWVDGSGPEFIRALK